jgi:hypothetical protein
MVPTNGYCEYSEEVKNFANEAALKAALEVRSELVDFEVDFIKKLGPKWEAKFLSAFGALCRRFGDKVDDLILLSDRMDIYTTQYEASLRFKAMELLESDIDQKDLKLTTFGSCEREMLCGALLAQHYGNACRSELLEGISAKGFPGTGAVLEAMSVNKLMLAAFCIVDNQQKALDLLADSVSAMQLSTQGEMQVESYFARKNDRSAIARKAANARLTNDPKHLAMKEIEKEFNASKYPFNKRGYTSKFVKEMAEKFTVIKDSKSIANLVARLKKQ